MPKLETTAQVIETLCVFLQSFIYRRNHQMLNAAYKKAVMEELKIFLDKVVLKFLKVGLDQESSDQKTKLT